MSNDDRCEAPSKRNSRCRLRWIHWNVRGWNVCGWHWDWATHKAPAREGKK